MAHKTTKLQKLSLQNHTLSISLERHSTSCAKKAMQQGQEKYAIHSENQCD